MHHIYHTEAVVLSSRPSGESGKYLTVISKEFGILKIEAQAVRANYSKLRSAIQDYSVSEISFVRGKSGNRLVSAVFVCNLFYQIDQESYLKILVKVFKLIERMVTHEEKIDEIYKLILFFGNFLKKNKEQGGQFVAQKSLKNLEVVIVYRILAELGYLSKTGDLQFLIEDEIDHNLFKKVENCGINKITNLINIAINESHL